MKPTLEQHHAIRSFKDGHNTCVVAYAGAGKTSTLVRMAEADKNVRGIYIAFNKRIAEEAQGRFPFSCQCRTAHSLAFRSIREEYDTTKMTTAPSLREAGIPAFTGNAATSREIVALTLRYFMQSDSSSIKSRHVPNLKKMGFEDTTRLTKEAIVATRAVWQRMTNPRDPFGLGHDGYLKLWALSKPKLSADYLLVDEAQDLNPVLLGIIDKQKAQIVAVGDSHQQIYEWRGAIDALEEVDGNRCRLTQSFRFGDAIAASANIILTLLGEDVPLRGVSDISDDVFYYDRSDIGVENDAVLCRTNAGVIENVIDCLAQGKKVHVAGGVHELIRMVEGARELMNNSPALVSELMGFTNWGEVQDFSGTDEGASLKSFVNLVDTYGTDKLLSALWRVSNTPISGGITISTTHKGKGLEWDSVRVAADFLLPGEGKKVTMAQLRLMYVAMTRAKRRLWLPSGILNQYEKADVI